jgi:hypothetical protein
VVVFAKPYVVGSASTSFSSANALTRIVGICVVLSAANIVELKSDDSAVNVAGCPEATPAGVLPRSGTLITVTNGVPPP